MGNVAYKLNLPEESRIYPVFHVSCLKKKLSPSVELSLNLPLLAANGTLAPKPDKVLQRRLKEKGNQARVEVLVQWKGTQPEDATWEDLDEIKRNFPNLEGKVF
ncbi:hypothetical protein Pint_07787 [Pistacia integerrima]|uniref:Uncharacterized protein n=1 Tax=Pistacia integerrima TaxID=434235 RepID=A0ACC0Y130_9ROSI|nr:hypothetical protein Pint_07787 [Pistacia integerrima]